MLLFFLKILFAHLLGDFVFQPKSLLHLKRTWTGIVLHALVHFALGAAILISVLTPRVLLVLFVLAAFHAVLDWVKLRFTEDNWISFSADQAAHVVMLLLAAAWIGFGDWTAVLRTALSVLNSERIFLIATAYIAVVPAAGIFIQKLTQYFLDRVEPTLLVDKPGLPDAGKYIGWLERSLILTFLLGGYGEAIGFLLAAKALARYPEMKADEKGHFAEYFLIGTLTSVGVALVIGVIVIKVQARLAIR